MVVPPSEYRTGVLYVCLFIKRCVSSSSDVRVKARTTAGATARATVRAAARTGVATVGTKTFAATGTADWALTRRERRSDLRFHGIADIIFSAVRELTENHCYVYRFHHPVTKTLNKTVTDCPTASDGRGNPTAGLNAGLGAPSIVTEFATNEVKVGIGSKKVSEVASTLPVLLTTLV